MVMSSMESSPVQHVQHCAQHPVAALCRDFGPVFTWQLGQQKLVAVVNHETIKTLLQQGDSKVSMRDQQQP